MLTALYQFITAGDTSGMSTDRAAAFATVRSMIQTTPPVLPPNTPWRMYPEVIAEGVKYPAIRYQMITDTAELTQSGDSGLYMPRVQFDVLTSNAIDRDTLGKALFNALQGFSGPMGGGSPLISTNTCVLIFDNAIDDYEPDRLLYRRMLDFHVIHN